MVVKGTESLTVTLENWRRSRRIVATSDVFVYGGNKEWEVRKPQTTLIIIDTPHHKDTGIRFALRVSTLPVLRYCLGFNTEIPNGGKKASIEAGCPCEPFVVAITPGPLPVFVPP